MFTGRFMDTIGATVQCGENSRFSVFEPMNDKTRKAVVVVNFGNEEDDAEVNIEGDQGGKAELCIPFQKDTTVLLPAKIRVPARTCAVLVQLKDR